MRANACRECGGNIIDIITDASGYTRVVCRRCGNTGNPADKTSVRLARLARKQADETRKMVQDLAIEAWNSENP